VVGATGPEGEVPTATSFVLVAATALLGTRPERGMGLPVDTGAEVG
jgi:hypothetical protein